MEYDWHYITLVIDNVIFIVENNVYDLTDKKHGKYSYIAELLIVTYFH